MGIPDRDKKCWDNLSPAELEQGEVIENELWAALDEGLPEDVAFKFVQTVMQVRKYQPGATVEAVFDMALRLGLPLVLAVVDGRLAASERKQQIRKGVRRGKLTGAGI
jgi:hypothetical protein